MALTTADRHFSAPQGGAIGTAADLDVDLDDETQRTEPRSARANGPGTA